MWRDIRWGGRNTAWKLRDRMKSKQVSSFVNCFEHNIDAFCMTDWGKLRNLLFPTGWMARCSNPGTEKICFFSPNMQNDSGDRPASNSVDTEILPRWQNGRSMKSTIHFQRVPRLGMSEGIPLLFLYAFLAWTGMLIFLPADAFTTVRCIEADTEGLMCYICHS